MARNSSDQNSKPPLPPKGRRARRILFGLARILALISMIIFAAGAIFKNRLIFHPTSTVWETPENYGLAFEEKWLKIKDGQAVKAWRLPPPPDWNGRTAILLQGNSGNMSMMTGRMVTLFRSGMSVLTVDYPGYGESEGRPSEEAAYQSAEALWEWAAACGAAPEDIVIYGYSLGGGVASWLAAGHPPAALVLDSTFTRISDVPSRKLPPLSPLFRLILGEAFDTKTRLEKDIHCPLLILHSPGDQVVPYQLGRELFQSYRNNFKEMVTGTGNHTDFIINEVLYREGIRRLLAASAPAGSTSGGDDFQPPQVGP